jgi:hypothetical protein
MPKLRRKDANMNATEIDIEKAESIKKYYEDCIHNGCPLNRFEQKTLDVCISFLALACRKPPLLQINPQTGEVRCLECENCSGRKRVRLWVLLNDWDKQIYLTNLQPIKMDDGYIRLEAGSETIEISKEELEGVRRVFDIDLKPGTCVPILVGEEEQ